MTPGPVTESPLPVSDPIVGEDSAGKDEKILTRPAAPAGSMGRMTSRPAVLKRRRHRVPILWILLSGLSLIAVFTLYPSIPQWVRTQLFGLPPQFSLLPLTTNSPTPQPISNAPLPPNSTTVFPTHENSTAAVAALVNTPSPLPTIPTDTPTSLPTTTPTPAPTPFAGSGEIAFASNRTGIMQIWLMNADGTNQRPITSLPDGACQPTWSPDGRYLAFISPCREKRTLYENTKIYILDTVEGDEPRLLPVPPSPAGDFDPAWSPDGNRIAFTSLRSGQPDIYVYNFKDSTLLRLTDKRNVEKQPAWSPSGTQIAFVREAPYAQIWIMSDTGQYPFPFTVSGELNNLWPAWSIDGSVIFYSQMRPSSNVPWLISMRYEDRGVPSKEARIPPRNEPDPGPVAKVSISPDGNWLAFESWPDGTNHDIYIMTINGGNRLRLTTDKDFDFGAVWRPRKP